MQNVAEAISDTLTFESLGTALTGTLEMPAGQPANASILLLSGSGPQDRDESIAGKFPFRVLSNALVSSGYQVFRWDDRGVGESGGDYQESSASDFVDDGATQWMQSRLRQILTNMF